MAKFVVTDPVIVIAGGTLTTSVASVTLNVEADNVETTAFGGGGWRSSISGLKQASVDFEFHQDFAAASVDATIAPLVGGTAAFEIRAVGTATAVSSTNPKWTGTVLVTEWSPLSGAVGELSTADVTWPVSGQVTRGTAA